VFETSEKNGLFSDSMSEIEGSEVLVDSNSNPSASFITSAPTITHVTLPLIEEGFWSSLVRKEKEGDFSQSRPNPLTMVDTEWASSEEASTVLQYIDSPLMFIESFELGLAPCRFLAAIRSSTSKMNLEGNNSLNSSLSSCHTPAIKNDENSVYSHCLSKEMGCASLTDGVYVFPEGLAHYIRRHNVRPSRAFVAHIQERLKKVEVFSQSSVDFSSRRLLFDPEIGKGVTVPAETRQYLLVHSSLSGL